MEVGMPGAGMHEGLGLLPCFSWLLKDLHFYFINMLFLLPLFIWKWLRSLS